MIEIEININLKKVLEEFSTEKLTKTLNGKPVSIGVAHQFATTSALYIWDGKVKPELNPITIQQRKKHFSYVPDKNPLNLTGELAGSLRGSEKGITGVDYAKKHRKGYIWKKGDNPPLPLSVNYRPGATYRKITWKDLKIKPREFITPLIESENKRTKEIFKGFQEDFVKLLKKRMRK